MRGLPPRVPYATVAAWKTVLYARLAHAPELLAQAAHALLGGPPTETQLPEVLDLAALGWVDHEGWTLVERCVADGALPPGAARWAHEARSGLWVVERWDGEDVALRNLATDAPSVVHAPGMEAELPPRAVLRAWLLPVGERLVLSGTPDTWGPMGVIARMDLLAQWRATPEPALLERLAALRAAFRRQREERDAFVAHFGADLVTFPDPATMERAFAELVNAVLNHARFPSLGGRTRAEAWRAAKGEDPKVIQVRLGGDLGGPGRHGIIYDAVEGVHVLPHLADVLDHLAGRGDHAETVRAYLADPGVTTLPFRRAAAADPGATARLAALIDVPDAPLETLLAPYKNLDGPVAPSVLPDFDD
jgi:hypothetical protein